MKELLKKKTTKIGIAVIILAVAVGIISISARSAQKQREYDGHVEAAEKYLTELDYEQAIAEYTLALEIEPNAEEVLNALEQTYLDYAQSLADAGNYGKAVSVLEEGYAQTGRESLREKIEELKDLQAQKSDIIVFPFELTDFRIIGCDILNENSHKFFEMFDCWMMNSFDSDSRFTNNQSAPDYSMLKVAGNLPDNTGSSGGYISTGNEGSSAYYMRLSMSWDTQYDRAALIMRAQNISELNYNILDYTDSPIIAGISTYEDWCQIMQVDSIKEYGQPGEDSSYSTWVCQSTWGEVYYRETNTTSSCVLSIDGSDGSHYEFSVSVLPDGLIEGFSLRRNTSEYPQNR